MKKLLFVAICAMAVMMSCKNKGQNAAAEGADSDSVFVDSVLAPCLWKQVIRTSFSSAVSVPT